MEKYGKYWKNDRFSGRIWPDRGNTTRADMAGLGSIGLSDPTRSRVVIMVNFFQTELMVEICSESLVRPIGKIITHEI